MIIYILLAIAVITFIWYASIHKFGKYNKGIEDTLMSIIATSLILVTISTITILNSYANYARAKVFYETTQEQYRSSLIIYQGEKVLTIQGVSTDLVNLGYQENIETFIRALRNRIIKYNNTITSKRIYATNLFFKPFIVLPDDSMIPIRMIQ